MTIDELLDCFDDNIKKICKQAQEFCFEHEDDGSIKTPEEQFLYSVNRANLNISENYASRLERIKTYLNINAEFGQCFGSYNTCGGSDWYKKLCTYETNMKKSLNKAKESLEEAGKVKQKNDGNEVNSSEIKSTLSKLYSSCKKKLNSVTKKGLFGRHLVKRFFDKYFSGDGKSFSKKINKRLKNSTVKELNKIKEEIKRECLGLLDKEKAREILKQKFNK